LRRGKLRLRVFWEGQTRQGVRAGLAKVPLPVEIRESTLQAPGGNCVRCRKKAVAHSVPPSQRTRRERDGGSRAKPHLVITLGSTSVSPAARFYLLRARFKNVSALAYRRPRRGTGEAPCPPSKNQVSRSDPCNPSTREAMLHAVLLRLSMTFTQGHSQ
jgi:hypothetical protein